MLTWYASAANSRSVKLTAAAPTSTTTSPSAGTGSGSSSTRSRSDSSATGPWATHRTARTGRRYADSADGQAEQIGPGGMPRPERRRFPDQLAPLQVEQAADAVHLGRQLAVVG